MNGIVLSFLAFTLFPDVKVFFCQEGLCEEYLGSILPNSYPPNYTCPFAHGQIWADIMLSMFHSGYFKGQPRTAFLPQWLRLEEPKSVVIAQIFYRYDNPKGLWLPEYTEYAWKLIFFILTDS